MLAWRAHLMDSLRFLHADCRLLPEAHRFVLVLVSLLLLSCSDCDGGGYGGSQGLETTSSQAHGTLPVIAFSLSVLMFLNGYHRSIKVK